jgi:outer membrane beta-barrel protein
MRRNVYSIFIISAISLIGMGLICHEVEAGENTEEVVQVDIERRDVRLSEIEAQNIELGVFFGVLSIENFGSQAMYGIRAAYHITELFFIEGVSGQSSITDQVLRSEGVSPVFSSDKENIDFYNLSIGFNLFSGETFFAGKWALNSSGYVKAGAGSIDLVVDDKLTFNLGIGIRFVINDYLAFHVDMEDMVAESGILAGNNSITHNLQLHTGFTLFF